MILAGTAAEDVNFPYLCIVLLGARWNFVSPAIPLAPPQTLVVARIPGRHVETFRAFIAQKIEGQLAGTPEELALFDFASVFFAAMGATR